MRRSRPGPSGWKLAVIELFPESIQNLYWDATDLQREGCMVADVCKQGVQVNIALWGRPAAAYAVGDI